MGQQVPLRRVGSHADECHDTEHSATAARLGRLGSVAPAALSCVLPARRRPDKVFSNHGTMVFTL